MRNLTKRVVVSSHAFSVLWPAGALPPLLEYPPTALWELSRKWDERKVGPTRGLKGVCAWSRRSGKRGRPCVETDSCRSPIHTPHTPPFQCVPFEKLCHRWRDISRGPRDRRIDGDDASLLFFFSFNDLLVVETLKTRRWIDPSIRWNLSADSLCLTKERA